ncbi:hypothetical protein DXG01_005080 [Tephrocybe rancida]|nr:hypothetical protein DXG01_005080 [Tephrocybe rancida]
MTGWEPLVLLLDSMSTLPTSMTINRLVDPLGNEAPQVSIEVLHGSPSEEPQVNDPRWTEVLPKVDMGPSSRHLLTIPETGEVNYVKLNMYPDGGIARFRVYGHVSPVIPSDASEIFDLAHVFAGGHVEFTSDQHFGVGANLIVPGRGKNMGGGWETKRSRAKGHKDWVIIKLRVITSSLGIRMFDILHSGVPGVLEHVEIDTNHFKGNFPDSCEIHGLYSKSDIDWKTHEDRDEDWAIILPRIKLGPHRQHYFQFENVEGKTYSHVKLTIHPDGGLQRIRVLGRRSSSANSGVEGSSILDSKTPETTIAVPVTTSTTSRIVSVLPLTPEGFAPFGKVIQGYADLHAVPKGTKITPANAGTAQKFHKLSLLEASYPAVAGATSGISVYRCQPCQDVKDGHLELKVLERHPFTNQAFIPMGQGSGEGLKDPGLKYLVVVAQNGANDRPDTSTLRAFVATAAQGIVYNTAIWHQPMTVLDKTEQELDLACVETQIGNGSNADCEILQLVRSCKSLAKRVTTSAVVLSISTFAFMEVSRKRAHADEEDSTATKKRVLTGPNGSPQVNGAAKDKEEFDSDNLEVKRVQYFSGSLLNENSQLFRKEAIYRRMRHYSRENERSQSCIEDLEKRKQSCEAGLAAMTACWNQLVKTIRPLVKTDELPEVADEMFDFTIHIKEANSPDFDKMLRDNMSATQSLVTHLVKAGESSQAHSLNGDAVWGHQKETAERISLQSQLDLARANLRDAEELKERYRTDLQAAENRLDRLRSKTVSAMQSRTPEQQTTSSEGATEESQRKPSSPAGSKSPVQYNDICDPTEVEVLKAQLAVRETTISELEQRAIALTGQNLMLEAELKELSPETIEKNPHYMILGDQTRFLQDSLNESRQQASAVTNELNSLKASRVEWESGVIIAANQSNQELKSMLAKRDVDNARLREQREQQGAELLERKQQESVKLSSLRETKALNESRLERIAVLESQVARLKAQLAANASDEDLMKFFLEGHTDEAHYFESLKERTSVAEQRASVVELLLSKYQEAHPDVAEHFKAEADALQKVADIQLQLDKYKAVYGDTSALPPDTSTLVEQLRHKEEEVQRLRLQDIQHTQASSHIAETTLYAELDKLSTAWESLERQVKDKVFDLSNLENQLKKAASEARLQFLRSLCFALTVCIAVQKAKSENKYYASMRDKDAVSVETAKLQRNIEKQNKVIERLVDAEKNLSAQLTALEKELALTKSQSLAYSNKVTALSEYVSQWTGRFRAEKQRINDVSKILGELVTLETSDSTFKIEKMFRDEKAKDVTKRTELRKIEDSLIRTKKELEAKAKQAPAGDENQNSEAEKLLLSVGLV